MSSLITYDNFSKICRCCIINQGEMNVFEAHLERAPLSSIIFNFTNETISQADGLPKEICNSCAQLLINFHSFIKIFEEAQCHIKYMYEAFSNQIKTDNRIYGSDPLYISNEDEIREKEIEKFLEVKGSSEISKKKIDMNVETIIEKEIKENFSKQKTDFEETSDGSVNDISIITINDEEMNEIYSEEGQKYTEDEQSFDQIELLGLNIDNKLNEVDEKTEKDIDQLPKSILDLQCFQCLLLFSTRAEMNEHYRSTGHTMAPIYKCSICAKAIGKRKAYYDHMATHKQSRKKAMCEVCGTVVLSVHLRRHMLIHHEKSYVCQYCGKEYVKKSALTNHVQSKHEADTKDSNSLCFICGKLCNDSKSLISHLNTHTDDKRKNLLHHCEQSQTLNTHDFMAHKTAIRIPKHMKTKACKRRTSIQNRLGSSSNEPKPENPLVKKAGNKKRKIECPVCDKKISYYGFSQHLMIHTGKKPYKCEYCPKSYRLHPSLKMHMNVHWNLKPFKCDICSQQFRHYTTLKVHRRIHTGEKPYICTVCSKSFRGASSLKKHGTVHTGERRYVCVVCSKTFRGNCGLKKHQKLKQHIPTLVEEKAIHSGMAEISNKF